MTTYLTDEQSTESEATTGLDQLADEQATVTDEAIADLGTELLAAGADADTAVAALVVLADPADAMPEDETTIPAIPADAELAGMLNPRLDALTSDRERSFVVAYVDAVYVGLTTGGIVPVLDVERAAATLRRVRADQRVSAIGIAEGFSFSALYAHPTIAGSPRMTDVQPLIAATSTAVATMAAASPTAVSADPLSDAVRASVAFRSLRNALTLTENAYEAIVSALSDDDAAIVEQRTTDAMAEQLTGDDTRSAFPRFGTADDGSLTVSFGKSARSRGTGERRATSTLGLTDQHIVHAVRTVGDGCFMSCGKVTSATSVARPAGVSSSGLTGQQWKRALDVQHLASFGITATTDGAGTRGFTYNAATDDGADPAGTVAEAADAE